MSELLRMEHISKRFGDFYANKDISLTVNRGEVLTLLGENGAGKSTLMNILIGLSQLDCLAGNRHGAPALYAGGGNDCL